tara:strand:- start:368 stop:940 length:573 start_codon:yes stop_codon:yes gene_type:complete
MIKLKEILHEAQVSKELWYHINNNISLEECVFRYGSKKYFTLINEARILSCEEDIEFDNSTRALLETDLGKFGIYEGKEVALDFPLINHEVLEEKKKAKKPKKKPIGKPKRGGPKAYYVYVKKGDKIKKVTFGSGGLRAKINNPKARKAFAARHRCSTAKDRTTARYWSCRLPRYAKQLGLSVKNPGGFW